MGGIHAGYFIALQERFIACGVGLTLYAMVLRFVVGPALTAVGSLAMGLHGKVLRIAVIQVTYLQPSTIFSAHHLIPHCQTTTTIIRTSCSFFV